MTQIAALLWAMLQTRQSFFTPYTIPAAVTDFLLHCAAILFATTVYADGPQILVGLLLLPAVAILLQPRVESKATPKTDAPIVGNEGKAKVSEETALAKELDPLPIKPFITTYRGAMMVITCTSILAVDFKIFPRRFAKTESFGTSLMDVGVGSFVFAAGLVAARQQLKEQLQGHVPSYSGRIASSIKHALPLFALGLARLFSVKNLDYVEHVSEYGVHWNFFFTLALLGPTTAVLLPILRRLPTLGGLTFFIACVYECCLYFVPGLKAYIILSERKPGDWFSQNREGVFSFIGYFAIFIAGLGTGMTILQRDPGSQAQPLEGVKAEDPLDEDDQWLADVLGSADQQNVTGQTAENEPAKTGGELAAEKKNMPHPDPLGLIWIANSGDSSVFLAKWTAIWFVLCVWAMWHYGPHLFVSRRMANLAYIVWICCFNSAQLLLFNLIERVFFPNVHKAKDRQTERQRVQDATSRIMHAFNRNGLVLFLMANLLTGGINMAIPTLHLDDVTAMAVLLGYIGTLAGTALALDHFDVSIKL